MKKRINLYATAWLLLAANGTASGGVQLGFSQSDDKALAFQSDLGGRLEQFSRWPESRAVDTLVRMARRISLHLQPAP